MELININKYKNARINKEELIIYLEAFRQKTLKMLDKFKGGFWSSSSLCDKYREAKGFEWTKGFCTGQILQLYMWQKDDNLLFYALKQYEELKKMTKLGNLGIKNHDAGFLYSISAGALYKMFKNEDYKKTLIMAADTLKNRFLNKCGVIQAWGNIGEPGENAGRIIIDTFMNLPLLYEVSLLTGDKSYKEVALSHLDKAIQVLIRPDYTTYHTYYFDVETGKPLYGKTHQGKSDESCWARGQAWGIYGLMLSYKYNQDRKDLFYLAKNLLNKFLDMLPSDLVSPWDFSYDNYDDVMKDSSATVIALLGILEMLDTDLLTEEEAKIYRKVFKAVLNSLIKNDYLSKDISTEDGLLRHQIYHSPFVDTKGMNEFCLWGDYFICELLVKLVKRNVIKFW